MQYVRPSVFRKRFALGVCLSWIVLSSVAWADDWTRFRGPNGAGVSQDAGVPVTWSDTENLKWKADVDFRPLPLAAR